MKSKERDKSILEYVRTIMYTHIRSQASDWNCCVKRLVCAQQSISLISTYYDIRQIPHK